MTTDPDVILSMRDLIVAESAITDLLSTFGGAPAVFTRIPVPDAAIYPMITISRNRMQANEDGVSDHRPVLGYEIATHGRNDLPPSQYRDVSTIAHAIRALFHRRRNIRLQDWAIIDQRCLGPTELSPVDQITTRVVTLNVRLAIRNEANPPSLLIAGGAGLLLNTTGGAVVLSGS